MKRFKKITAIILCAILAFTAIPLSVFAADTTDYYCKIEFKTGCKDNLRPGETTEIYVDYYAGDNKDISIVWSAPGNTCEYKYVTDSETELITGMKITSVSGGMFYVFVSILDSEGNELAKDNIEIWSAEPDDRTLKEKVDEFINMLPAKLGFLGYGLAYIISIVTVGPITGVWETCIVVYNKLSELTNKLYELING